MRVSINNNDCAISSVTPSSITCLTPANAAGTYDVAVVYQPSAGTETTYDSSVTFEYSTQITPAVTDLSPNEGKFQLVKS